MMADRWLLATATSYCTDLCQAIEERNLEVIKELISEDELCLITKISTDDHDEDHKRDDVDLPLHTVCNDPNNLEIVKVLLFECTDDIKRQQLKAKTPHRGNTALHIAAENGCIEIVKIIIDEDQELLDITNNRNDTPVSCAAIKGNNNVLRLMLKYEMHIARKPSSLPLESITEINDVPNKFETALVRACQFGQVEVVKFLIDQGIEPSLQALRKGIDGLYSGCVEEVLLRGYFRKHLLLKPFKNHENSHSKTNGFCELIKFIPDVAETVLDECVTFDQELIKSPDLKIKFNYELIDGDYEKSTIKEFLEKCWNLLEQDEDWLRNYAAIHSTKERKIRFNKETHPLSLMAKYKQDNLLSHPIVASLIHDKWNSAYGVCNIVLWLLFAVVFCCINALIFLLPKPQSYACITATSKDPVKNQTITNDDDITTTYTVLAALILLYSIFRLSLELYQFLSSLHFVIITFDDIKSSKVIFRLCKAIGKVDYIWDIINWNEVTLFILALHYSIFVLLSENDGYCLSSFEWQIGVVVVWLSWIEFIFLSAQFKVIGVHAIMFLRVLRSLLKFIPLALLMISAFGIAFHLLLYSTIKSSPYANLSIINALLKTLSFSVGEIGVEYFIHIESLSDEIHIHNAKLVMFFWVLAVFFITILLSNLMIGLAVGDIQEIYERAVHIKLGLQIDYVLMAESQFPIWIKRKYIEKKQKVFEPNKMSESMQHYIRQELVYFFWGGTRYDSKESICKLVQPKKFKVGLKSI